VLVKVLIMLRIYDQILSLFLELSLISKAVWRGACKMLHHSGCLKAIRLILFGMQENAGNQ